MRGWLHTVAATLLTLTATAVSAPITAAQAVSGPLTKWETLTVDFAGPSASELDGRGLPNGPTDMPNPFLDYRLQVRFTSPSGRVYDVPGFFDGDGEGGGEGDVWRVRFTPDEPGSWTYTASFREGANVALDLDPAAGAASSTIDGASGSFVIGDTAPSATGAFRTGRLEYDGTHYLKQRDGGYWLKSGADSPENWLGYKGFDNTQTKGSGGAIGVLHEFNAHLGDWRPGDPDWDTPDYAFANDHDGRRIIGAVNYLADLGINAIYFLPMNIGGDAKDSHPYAKVSTTKQLNGDPANDNLHYDISKLTQWEKLFRHAQTRGVLLQFVLNEAEPPNKRELDDAKLGVERKLFYREMVARFGHHNALEWNLSEEYDLDLNLGADTVKAFAAYLRAVDPYDHPLTVHNAGDPAIPHKGPWGPFIGDKNFDITSLQHAAREKDWGDIVQAYREASTAAGQPLVVMIDEPESPSRINLGPAEHRNQGADATRRFMTWAIYLSGGCGVEWFIHNRDQTLEDFGETYTAGGVKLDLDQLWKETVIARQFTQALPFWEMQPADELLRNEDGDYGGGELFAKPGEVYAFYLPDGSNDDGPDGAAPELDLTDQAGRTFVLRWFDPRVGEFVGDPFGLEGGDWVSIGATPDGIRATSDWVGLVAASDAELLGDFDRDGDVDNDDFGVFAGAFGGPGPLGDFDRDGDVDDDDFAVFAGAMKGEAPPAPGP